MHLFKIGTSRYYLLIYSFMFLVFIFNCHKLKGTLYLKRKIQLLSTKPIKAAINNIHRGVIQHSRTQQNQLRPGSVESDFPQSKRSSYSDKSYSHFVILCFVKLLRHSVSFNLKGTKMNLQQICRDYITNKAAESKCFTKATELAGRRSQS